MINNNTLFKVLITKDQKIEISYYGGSIICQGNIKIYTPAAKKWVFAKGATTLDAYPGSTVIKRYHNVYLKIFALKATLPEKLFPS